ncbi:MAG: 4'-phosphopantetheinyl transferase superfamily protein [Planctomycetes bacterium]|nr:4'-phosphopantetheinyl transferase superfamily protein [Planctomycetota bacterium]
MTPSPPDAVPLPLARDTVHLWYVFLEELGVEELSACRRILSPDEQAHLDRLSLEKVHRQFLVTRALVRNVLSRYAAVDPLAWTFAKNRYGCPRLSGPPWVPPLSFNISHTNGLVAVLVALDREVGVDVEDAKRSGQTVEIADRFFSAVETAELRSLPVAAQRERFFEYWTLKESYIKARGMGLSIPLDQFTFHLAAGAKPRISFDSRLADDPSSWQFEELRASARHPVAVAIRRRGEPDLAIRVRRTLPAESIVPGA